MNVIELACATHQEASIHGSSREILENYLCSTLNMIGGNDYSRKLLIDARDSTDTFKYVIKFTEAMRPSGRLAKIHGLVNPHHER